MSFTLLSLKVALALATSATSAIAPRSTHPHNLLISAYLFELTGTTSYPYSAAFGVSSDGAVIAGCVSDAPINISQSTMLITPGSTQHIYPAYWPYSNANYSTWQIGSPTMPGSTQAAFTGVYWTGTAYNFSGTIFNDATHTSGFVSLSGAWPPTYYMTNNGTSYPCSYALGMSYLGSCGWYRANSSASQQHHYLMSTLITGISAPQTLALSSSAGVGYSISSPYNPPGASPMYGSYVSGNSGSNAVYWELAFSKTGGKLSSYIWPPTINTHRIPYGSSTAGKAYGIAGGFGPHNTLTGNYVVGEDSSNSYGFSYLQNSTQNATTTSEFTRNTITAPYAVWGNGDYVGADSDGTTWEAFVSASSSSLWDWLNSPAWSPATPMGASPAEGIGNFSWLTSTNGFTELGTGDNYYVGYGLATGTQTRGFLVII